MFTCALELRLERSRNVWREQYTCVSQPVGTPVGKSMAIMQHSKLFNTADTTGGPPM